MTDHEQKYLDDALRNAGTSSTERFLAANLPFDSVLGSGARPDGIARSFVQGPYGDAVVSLDVFQPGVDNGLTLDVSASLAGKEAKARRKNVLASPNNVHVVIDEPERTKLLTGDFSYGNIADFTVALCGKVATSAGCGLYVYHNNGNRAGLLFNGKGSETREAFQEIHGETNRKPIEKAKDPTLLGVLSLAGSITQPENDVIIVVSDFLEGYDTASNTLECESTVRQIVHDMDDRFRAVRVQSPAQMSIPIGLSDLLPIGATSEINRSNAELARLKDLRIVEALRRVRSVEIETFKHLSEIHPAEQLAHFIVGASLE